MKKFFLLSAALASCSALAGCHDTPTTMHFHDTLGVEDCLKQSGTCDVTVFGTEYNSFSGWCPNHVLTCDLDKPVRIRFDHGSRDLNATLVGVYSQNRATLNVDSGEFAAAKSIYSYKEGGRIELR